MNLWELFVNIDAVQVEINPLVQTADDQVIAMDAKIQVDDNASFRQKEIFEKHDHSESNPKEVEAARHNLNYIAMDGNIGCLGRNYDDDILYGLFNFTLEKLASNCN